MRASQGGNGRKLLLDVRFCFPASSSVFISPWSDWRLCLVIVAPEEPAVVGSGIVCVCMRVRFSFAVDHVVAANIDSVGARGRCLDADHLSDNGGGIGSVDDWLAVVGLLEVGVADRWSSSG